MKTQISGIVLLLGVALLAGQARASIVNINFDDLTPGCNPPGSTAACATPAGIAPPLPGSHVIIVTNQYFVSDGVTFASSGQFVVLVESGTGYNTTSTPNVISTGNAAGAVLGAPSINLILTFANPAYNLMFDVFGNDTTPNGSTFAMADVYQDGVVTTIPLLVSQGGTPVNGNTGVNADHQDLSAFAGITQLVIHDDTDTNGSAYDNFSFDTGGGTDTSVPEPSTLLLTGLCGIVWTGRRFRARKSI